jgi:hypothetical protein
MPPLSDALSNWFVDPYLRFWLDFLLRISTILAWPLVVGFSLWVFRTELATVVRRIQEVTAAGASIKLKPHEQTVTASPVENAREAVETAAEAAVKSTNADEPDQEPLLATNVQARIIRELDDRGRLVLGPIVGNVIKELEERFPGHAEAQLAAVIRALAAQSVQKSHEITYRTIFGSQIKACGICLILAPPRARRFLDSMCRQLRRSRNSTTTFHLNRGYTS